MADFRKLISPRSRREHQSVTDFLEGFSRMEAPDMVRSLLDMSRRAFSLAGYRSDRFFSYDEAALLRIIPEIALRLNPDVVLTTLETAKPEEAADKVTWIKGADNDRLREMVVSCLQNASFHKILHGSGDDRAPHDPERKFLHDVFAIRREEGVMARAFNALVPGSFDISGSEEKPPLEGLYVILEREHRDAVYGYSEDHEAARSAYSLIVENIDRPTENQDLAFKERFREQGTVLAVSLQDFKGSVLDRRDLHMSDDSPQP